LVRSDDIARHFDDVAQMLAALDVQRTWAAATEVERRVLLDEFLEDLAVLPDYIDVNIHGAPPIHVLYQEVGLKESDFDRVGGGTGNQSPRPVIVKSGWSERLRPARATLEMARIGDDSKRSPNFIEESLRMMESAGDFRRPAGGATAD
jgi:hypothetical protein